MTDQAEVSLDAEIQVFIKDAMRKAANNTIAACALECEIVEASSHSENRKSGARECLQRVLALKTPETPVPETPKENHSDKQ